MKKFPLWTTSIPIIMTAALFQYTFDLGEQGKLNSQFLRDRIYPVAQIINGAMTNFKFRSRGPTAPKNNVIIVEADDDSLSTLGRWPWHREVYAQLIHAIFQLGAKGLALDVAYSEPEERIPPEVYEKLKTNPKLLAEVRAFEGDPILGEVVKTYRDRLVLGYASDLECQPRYNPKAECPVLDASLQADVNTQIEKFALHDEYPFDDALIEKSPFKFFIRVFSNIPTLRDVAQHSGFFGVDPDTDGYIRRYSLVALAHKKIYPSLALSLAEVIKGDHIKIDFSKDGLINRAYFANEPTSPIPVTPLGYVNLNFRGPSRSFKYVSVIDVFKAFDANDAEMKKLFKDAAVFFGTSAVGIYDMRAFPFDSNTPGVEGHATAFDNLLSSDELKSASSINLKWLPLTLLIVLGLLFAWVFSNMQAVPSLLLFIAFMTTLGLIDLKLLFNHGINIPTAFLVIETLSIFGFILSIRYILEERNKKFVREAFSKYLAPQVVDLVLEDPSKLAVGGERRELTILFSDLRGFTSFSENMDPKTLTQFLNEYLSEMTEIVFEHQGTLDKYIGDAVMAFWGAPLHQDNHAELAWKAAVKMTQRLKEIAPEFKKKYGIDVSAGIGINSGVVSVGNMGSKRIFEYTVIGDHVNLASRLESLTRLYGCDILSTQESFNLIPDALKKEFHCRVLDSVKVKGKKNAVEVIQISDMPIATGLTENYAAAKAEFQKRNWDRAKELFKAASDAQKNATGHEDPTSEVYIQRCELFKANPPDENWDGSIEMRQK